jgi:hypothetical protein
MRLSWTNLLQVEVAAPPERQRLAQAARERNWGLAVLLTGWLHLGAFSLCYYLTIARDYHDSSGYLAIWISELCGMWLIFRACGGKRTTEPTPLELYIRRVWIAYFLLAFNLGSLNTLRGHAMFEFFPAIASLASFAFLMMSVVVSGRFFNAVLVMFASGLLMAAQLPHAYLIFALAWWLVLNAIGIVLVLDQRRQSAVTQVTLPSSRESASCAFSSSGLRCP